MALNNKLLVTGSGGHVVGLAPEMFKIFWRAKWEGFFIFSIGSFVSKGGLLSRWGASPGTGPPGWCVWLSPKQLESVTFGG